MYFVEPSIEFVPVDYEDIVCTSGGGGGASIVVCAPGADRDSDFPDVPIVD